MFDALSTLVLRRPKAVLVLSMTLFLAAGAFRVGAIPLSLLHI